MSITALQVIGVVRSQLSDNDSVRWSDSDLLTYVGLAQNQIVQVRPDASATLLAQKLVAGTKQTLPATVYRFLGAVYNLGSDGETPGAAIANTDMGLKDAFNPTWRSGTTTNSTIRECLYDSINPSTFWVYPSVPATPVVYIGIRVSQLPTAPTNVNSTLTISDIYKTPLILLTLGFAYGENSDAGDKQLAASYAQQALSLLEVQSKTDAAIPPIQRGDGS